MADFSRIRSPYFGTGSILVVETPDGGALEARSVDSEDVAWQKLTIPPGLRVTPIAGEDTLALAYKGESIKQLAAFSAHTGDWSTVQLVEPVHETICTGRWTWWRTRIRRGTPSTRSAHKRVRGTFSKLPADTKPARETACEPFTEVHLGPARQPALRFQPEARQVVAGRDDETSGRKKGRLPVPERTAKAMIQPASSRSRRSRSSACSGVTSSGPNCRSSLRSGSGSAANKLF